MGSSMGNREIQPTSETEIRLTSPPSVSRINGITAPVGMAIPISQDLIWPGHPDICDAARVWGRPKATKHTKKCLLPRRPGCQLNHLNYSPTKGGGGVRALRSSPG